MNITEALAVLLFITLAACAILWFGYWGPRSRVFKLGERAVPVWFGTGWLVLWNEGETFVFQKNKQFQDVGESTGGMRTISWIRGEQFVGPIPLRTALLDWEDPQVLTREAQPLGHQSCGMVENQEP
ncbi:MAG: hypothetical protein WCC04_22390 [Terriglobales bacterium]